MLELQLYIEGEQVELHDNESITLTQTLQNVKDIQKIFTDFTQTFNVPASKTNNKIFKHFYNADIVGFDARNKKDSELLINYKPFKKGKVKLEGVQMSNNQPVNYRLTFFGKAVNLKDVIGEDKLDNLSLLTEFNIQYDAQSIINLMQSARTIFTNGEIFTGAILVPLITHTQRLYYNSAEDEALSGNLHNGSTAKGVYYEELKPALRVYAIIRAIEREYNLKFSDDFFNKTNETFYNLYMWMHRKKGGILEENETKREVQFNNFSNITFSHRRAAETFTRFGFKNINHNNRVERRINVKIDVASTVNYDFIIKKNGETYFREDGNTGSKSFVGFSNDFVFESGTDHYTVHLLTEDSATFSATLQIKHTRISYALGVKITNSDQAQATASLTTGTDIQIITTSQVPEIKVMDFLTGLFKMFNLTAYQEEDTIIVRTLDSFYDSSTQSYDITKYLDKTTSEVNAIMPYSEITLEYKGSDSFFAKKHKELNNLEWGTSHFDNKGIYEGSTYKITLPFEHHKFERLLDAGDNNANTSVQWGWSVDDKQDSYLGKPLLFYPHLISGGTPISVRKTASTKEATSSYHIPSNSVDPISESQSINFNAELNEYTGKIFKDSLFNTFYKKYIVDTFNINRRLSKFKAYLPLKVILNLKLQDKIVVFNNLYKINSLKTNFETGLSDLELINEVSDFDIPVNDTDLARSVNTDFVTADITTITADTGTLSI